MSHVRMFAFWQGVPAALVLDNEKAGVHRASRYEPELSPSYAELAAHLRNRGAAGASGEAAGQQAKIETAMQHVERWVMAPLRNHTF